MDVVIPDWYDDLNPGDTAMELEIPWITRGAIYRLNELLDGTERVLEFGAGGSTLFFARRCKSVVSFESDSRWFVRVKEELERKDIHNVTVKEFNSTDQLVQGVGELEDGNFNCTLIDTAKDPGAAGRREHLLRLYLARTNTEKSILVLDNYSYRYHFPESGRMSIDEFIDHYLTPEWDGEEFNQRRWGGSGTRIFYRGKML